MAEPAYDHHIDQELYIHLASPAVPESQQQPLGTFASDVRAGLLQCPKTLPSLYLYDAVGSSLFEAITNLAQYKCTVGEKRLLRRYAGEIARLLPANVIVAELGGGSGEKAALIVGELAAHRRSVSFHNVDISTTAIEMSSHLLSRFPNVVFAGHATTFDGGLAEVAAMRPPGAAMFILFLGSSIGNFEPAQAGTLLRSIRHRLKPGDYMLLGTDLLKPTKQLLLAYDDPAGVTAAFNKNILARINRELGANFDLELFHHESRWDADHKRIEMHLVSLANQKVNIRDAALSVTFKRGDSIRTEFSHKYQAAAISSWVSSYGFELSAQWLDPESRFASNLLLAV